MSSNLRYYFLVSDNKQRNYNSMSGPPSKFVVVSNSDNFKMQVSYSFQNQEEEKCDTLSK